MNPTTVSILAADEINYAGAARFLSSDDQLRLVAQAEAGAAEVVVLITGELMVADLNRLSALRAKQAGRRRPQRCVVVTDRFDPAMTMRAVEHGVKAVLPRVKIDRELLVSAVRAAGQGSAYLPAQLQRALLEQLNALRRGVLEPNGFSLAGLSDREVDVLGMVAAGLRTDEIAARMWCSEGTVKNVLYGVIDRFGLQNRAHAVAYAIRAGAL
ncbi:LuxR C-terminal-related transcriptional regulator [Amycolatopsis sp. NPDC059090]|uniref:helix-turn-helix transcriptional regulator n=1 Tax=unclassified Amycolatopsis TaxID=2618356 RepID=UPI003671694A